MNRFNHSSTTSLQHLLDVYSEGTQQTINSFIQKRFIRFTEPESKPTYYQLFLSNKNNNDEIKQVDKQHFLRECEQHSIDPFYYTNLSNSLEDLEYNQKVFLYNHELKEIKEKKSYFYVIKKIIKARQNCLINMKSILGQSMRQSIARLSELDKICMQMIHIRMLTLVLVQAIYQWNFSMSSFYEEGCKQIKYQQNGIQILNQICEDTDFLRSTILKRYLKFVKGFDPLLIRITRRRRQGNSNKVDDVDRFSDFFQPDFNILSRLREAQAVIIKYHSNKNNRSKDQIVSKSVGNFRVRQPHTQNVLMTTEMSETKHIQINPEVEIKPQKIDLPKMVEPKKFELNSREPGFIKSHQKLKLNYKNNVKSLTPNSMMKNSEKSTNIMEKIKVLKQKLKNNSYLQSKFKDERVRYDSQPNEQVPSKQKNLMRSMLKALPPVFSNQKLIPATSKKKRMSQKKQKIRFLKHIYRDKSRSDLQTQLSLINSRGCEAAKRRRKQKREQCLNFRSGVGNKINLKQGVASQFKFKCYSPF